MSYIDPEKVELPGSVARAILLQLETRGYGGGDTAATRRIEERHIAALRKALNLAN